MVNKIQNERTEKSETESVIGKKTSDAQRKKSKVEDESENATARNRDAEGAKREGLSGEASRKRV